jgi:hypothetical protein
MQRPAMRKWLEQNRIFFDVLVPVLLGLAALFVSLASYQVSKTQLALQIDQQNPHFYMRSASDSNNGMTPDAEILNDGGTFESIRVTSMPFVVGLDNSRGQSFFNVPIYTHQAVEQSGQKKERVATIKSDLSKELIKQLRTRRQGFVAIDENPRLLVLLLWKTKSDSGLQFFIDGQPVDSAEAESCYAFWHSQSEKSLASRNLTEKSFLEYYASLQTKPNPPVNRTTENRALAERHASRGCRLPTR